MTDILCRWLNEEVHLEPKIVVADPTFTEKFSNGYLLGQILYKHDLQPDFCLFSKGETSEAKLNNFTRLEITFKLLCIPFNANVARDVMSGRPGAAVQLMYQLFMALNRKTDRKMTAQSLECMKSPARVRLGRVETEIFQERLKYQTPRQVDLNFEELVSKFKEQKKLYDEKISQEKKEQEKQTFLTKMESCQRSVEYSRAVRERRSMMYAKLKPIETQKRALSSPGIHSTQYQTDPRNKSLAAETMRSIHVFEETLKKRLPSIGIVRSQSTSTIAERLANPYVSGDYLKTLHQRVADTTHARMDRDKRRRKVLVEQMDALYEYEEVKREKMLVERLMKQCQQERRIATQLMHIRKEKDTIRNNRILRQQQLAAQRDQEFQQALDREAGLALLEEKEKKEQLRHHRKIYRKNMAEKAEKNYQMNYKMCNKIVLKIIDFATKMAHYRELTKNLVPAKIVRDWKTLFVTGRPLYEETGLDNSMDTAYTALSSSLTRSSVYADTSNEQLLNDMDFQEYKDATSEWAPVDGLSGSLPDAVNPILSHAVYRLLDTVDPPKSPPPPPHTPKFLLRACIVGKPFTGKTSTLQHLSQAYGVVIVSIESMIKKAVETYQSEKTIVDEERKPSGLSNREELSNDVSVSEHCTTPQAPLNPSSSVDLALGSSGSVLLDISEGEGKEVELKEGEKKERVSAEEGKIRTCDSAGDSVTMELSDDQLLLFSPTAVLGHKAYVAMAGGEAMDDGLMVDILVNELHSFPEGSGWILDNFPTTVPQAKLLSDALSVPSSPKPDIPRDFVLLAEQDGCHEKLQGACGLDIVLHFSATTERVLERASSQAGSLPQSSYKLEQVQHRVLAYTENWPILRRWYSKFKVVSHINANVELSAVYGVAAENMLQIMNKNKQADAMKKLGYEDGVLSSGSVTSLASITSTSKSVTVKKSRSIHSPVSCHRPSSAESPCSTSKGRRKRMTKTPQSPLRHSIHPTHPSKDRVMKDEWVPINLDINPGSPEWEYYSRAISMVIAKGLARKWSNVEKIFIKTLKQIFKILRGERECICQYFFIRRNEFSTYLCRPDHKQEFISQWQVHYNQLEPHLRREEVMKAELHHRVDDLTDKLWDISERRKERSKEEQKRIADEKWLEDHTGLISNHFISIMQAELDRFQDTVLILKDYYASMGEKPPDKLPDLSRMALIDLPVTEIQDPPSSQAGSSHSVVPESSSKQLQEDTSPARDSVKRRVTLLPRQPPPDPMEDKTGKKRISLAAPISGLIEIQTGDLDQQLICYAYNTAVIAVASMVLGEVKVLDGMISEAKKPPKPKTPPPPEPKEEKTKAKKGKASPAAKKNSKTPPAGGKKGAAAAPPEPPPEIVSKPSMTPGEAMDKQRKIQACMEYKHGLQLEESRVKVRLELIRLKSIANITMLKSTNVAMHEEMDEWVQTCYGQEMESVNHLADILRQAIENEQKLLNEIVLPGAKFHIRESIVMFVPTPPPSPPPPVELPDHAYFTVDQLRHLHQQLLSAAPTGFMLVRVLVDTLQNMINRSSKDDMFPQLWRNASKQQIENMVDQLYGLDVNFVDWRRFLLCAAHPWPLPSAQDILEAWDALVPEREAIGRKTISKELFMGTEIWLDRPPEHVEELEGGFNRNYALKDALFDVFCEGSELDVRQMLLYLCADPYPKAGLFKALSLVTGSPLLSHQEVDGELTILLEDFHRILTLGLHADADTAAPPSMEDLLEVFVEVDLRNPNQVSLAGLLANKAGNELLYHSTGYSLLDLSALLRPLYGCPFTEGNNLTN